MQLIDLPEGSVFPDNYLSVVENSFFWSSLFVSLVIIARVKNLPGVECKNNLCPK